MEKTPKPAKSSNPYYLKNRERILEKMNQAYRTNPEYRAKKIACAKKHYHENETYRQATVERAKRAYREEKLRKEKNTQTTNDTN